MDFGRIPPKSSSEGLSSLHLQQTGNGRQPAHLRAHLRAHVRALPRPTAHLSVLQLRACSWKRSL